jgi:hypothetical protein
MVSGGGAYAPYFIPRFSTDAGAEHDIVITMSSWNPYQVHLVRSHLTDNGVVLQRPNPGTGTTALIHGNADFAQGLNGWYSTGDAFGVFNIGPTRWVNTYTAKGDAAKGTLYQFFWVDANVQSLQFCVHGGHGAVKLLRNDAVESVVRTTRGRHDNDVDVGVSWGLSSFRGELMEVLIEDAYDDPWGFINVSQMRFNYGGDDSPICPRVGMPPGHL